MIELISEIIDDKFIKHYAKDYLDNRYYIVKIETGEKYTEAIDLLPCKYTYAVLNEKIEEDVNG